MPTTLQPRLQPLRYLPRPASSSRLRRLSPHSFRRVVSLSVSSPVPSSPVTLDRLGGKMVAELVGAFNDITERMGSLSNISSSSQLLFKSLKLSIPLLQAADLAPDGRDQLSRALSVASLLADLQVIAPLLHFF